MFLLWGRYAQEKGGARRPRPPPRPDGGRTRRPTRRRASSAAGTSRRRTPCSWQSGSRADRLDSRRSRRAAPGLTPGTAPSRQCPLRQFCDNSSHAVPSGRVGASLTVLSGGRMRCAERSGSREVSSTPASTRATARTSSFTRNPTSTDAPASAHRELHDVREVQRVPIVRASRAGELAHRAAARASSCSTACQYAALLTCPSTSTSVTRNGHGPRARPRQVGRGARASSRSADPRSTRRRRRSPRYAPAWRRARGGSRRCRPRSARLRHRSRTSASPRPLPPIRSTR